MILTNCYNLQNILRYIVQAAILQPIQTGMPDKAIQVAEFITSIQERESQLRFPELFIQGRDGQVYYKRRNNLTVVAYHTPTVSSGILAPEEQSGIASYLFTQYSDPTVGRGQPFFDHEVAFDNSMSSEPLDSFFHDGDIHVVVGNEEGQIVGYIGVKGADDTGVTYGDYANRSNLSYVETVYGKPYTAYPTITNLPAESIREMRRFVTRQTIGGFQQAIISLELCLALFGMVDDFADQISVITGDFEPEVTMKNLVDVMGLPLITVPNRTPDLSMLPAPYNQLLVPRYEGKIVMPFAFASIDSMNGTRDRAGQFNNLLDRDIKSALTLVLGFLRRKQKTKLSSLTPEI